MICYTGAAVGAILTAGFISAVSIINNMELAQDIFRGEIAKAIIKKCRRSGLRRGFLICAIGKIDKLRRIGYLLTVP